MVDVKTEEAGISTKDPYLKTEDNTNPNTDEKSPEELKDY